MANVFLISDTHFNHANILTFKRDDGTPLRPFSSVEEMDETLIQNWNSVVRQQDKVYHLGDVSMNTKHLDILGRLKGDKVLIKGNHDKAKLGEYIKWFRDVRGSHQFDGMLLTHIPIHPESLGRWGVNVHGHLHYRNVMLSPHHPDKRYFNVSVEQINYTPISLEEVKKQCR